SCHGKRADEPRSPNREVGVVHFGSAFPGTYIEPYKKHVKSGELNRSTGKHLSDHKADEH
ncbi:MAG: hypothetical protein ACP5FU_04940, partial [Nitrososphaeria archaeon]